MPVLRGEARRKATPVLFLASTCWRHLRNLGPQGRVVVDVLSVAALFALFLVPNLFVVGASAFPQITAYNPTGTVGALSYMSADAIVNQYLKNPGPLVS